MRRTIQQGVCVNERPPFRDAHGVGRKIAGHIQPRLAVVVRHVHHERVPVPAAARVSHPQLDALAKVGPAVQVNHSGGVCFLAEHDDGVASLDDLVDRRHVERARHAGHQAQRVGVEILVEVRVAGAGGGREIRNQAVCRIDDPRLLRPVERVAGELLDGDVHACPPPDPGQVGRAGGRARRRERLRLLHRASVKRRQVDGRASRLCGLPALAALACDWRRPQPGNRQHDHKRLHGTHLVRSHEASLSLGSSVLDGFYAGRVHARQWNNRRRAPGRSRASAPR